MAAAARPSGEEERLLGEGHARVSVAVIGRDGGHAGARTAPRPPKNRSATTGAMSAWLSSPLRLQPGEHPVHHAEQQHRQRLLQRVPRAARGGIARSRRRTRRRRLRSPSRTRRRLGRREEAHVLGQDAVLGLRAGVDREEGRRSGGAARLGRGRRRIDLVDQRQQPGDVRLRRSRAAAGACRARSGRATAWRRRRPRRPRSSTSPCSRAARTARRRGRGSVSRCSS